MLRRAALLSSGLTSAGVKNGIIQDDWDTINEICKAGRASEFYSIGNRKVVSLEGIGDATFRFAGIKADIKADRTGVAETSWIIDCALPRSDICDDAYYNSLRQASSRPSASLCNILAIFYKLETIFPSNFYNMIVPIKKPYVWTLSYRSGNSYYNYNYTSYMDSKVWWATGVELFSTEYGSCLYNGFVESLGGTLSTSSGTGGLSSRNAYTDTRGNGFFPSTTLNGTESYGEGTHYLIGFCL